MYVCVCVCVGGACGSRVAVDRQMEAVMDVETCLNIILMVFQTFLIKLF